MSPPRFFFDEHVNRDLLMLLRTAHPTIDILCVGDKGAPAKSSPDEDLLEFAETEKRILVTLDKRTMPPHLERHFNAGRHTWGVLILRPGLSISQYGGSLSLVWQASEADEWFDRTDFLPY